jgi:hypothetical protein
MLVLMMAAFSPYPTPTVFLNQLHNVSHLHDATIGFTFKAVNTSQISWILKPGQYSIAAIRALNNEYLEYLVKQFCLVHTENCFSIFGIC